MRKLLSYFINIKYGKINRKTHPFQTEYISGETNNCHYENQFGFRKLHSTNHVLITITEKIRHTLDNNYYISGVFLDFLF